MKFEALITRQGLNVQVTLKGWLDESSEWPDWEAPIEGDLMIDLSEVTLMNSLGCRGWIKWLRSARVKGDVIVQRCSPVVVKQINILEGFFNDDTRIDSVYVPYFCEDCGFEDQRLLDIQSLAPRFDVTDVMLQYTCPKCAKRMELDMVRSQYLFFLQKQKAKFA